jgi:hypothetical protein
MKKDETPQDKGPLEYMAPQLCYVKNENGNYDTVLSKGWEVQTKALDNAWEIIHERVDKARTAVEQGIKSPIFYYMEKNLMNISLLSSYVKFNKMRIRLHMRPSVYKRLNPNILNRYAKAFNIKPEELDTLK